MSRYVFDQAWEQERARLASLEAWLDPGTTRHMAELGVDKSWRCLEVGGGGGSVTQWLCARAGEVVATDLDTRFLQALDEPNLTVTEHDITSGPIEKDAFDLVHARLLLEHLPARADALSNMIAAAKPGGWILVEDMDMISHVSITESEVYDRVGEGMIAAMSAVGFNAYFGRELVKLFADAGLQDVRAEGRIVMDGLENSAGLAMYKLTLTHLAPAIEATGKATQAEVQDVIAMLDDPAFMSLPPAIIAAWGRKPA